MEKPLNFKSNIDERSPDPQHMALNKLFNVLVKNYGKETHIMKELEAKTGIAPIVLSRWLAGNHTPNPSIRHTIINFLHELANTPPQIKKPDSVFKNLLPPTESVEKPQTPSVSQKVPTKNQAETPEEEPASIIAADAPTVIENDIQGTGFRWSQKKPRATKQNSEVKEKKRPKQETKIVVENKKESRYKHLNEYEADLLDYLKRNFYNSDFSLPQIKFNIKTVRDHRHIYQHIEYLWSKGYLKSPVVGADGRDYYRIKYPSDNFA